MAVEIFGSPLNGSYVPLEFGQYIPIDEFTREEESKYAAAGDPLADPPPPYEDSYSERQKQWIVALKIALVAVVVIGLIATSVVSFGAAGSAVAAQQGALYGISMGSALSALAALPIAYKNDMHKFTQYNFEDAVKFTLVQALATLVLVGSSVYLGTHHGHAIANKLMPIRPLLQ